MAHFFDGLIECRLVNVTLTSTWSFWANCQKPLNPSVIPIVLTNGRYVPESRQSNHRKGCALERSRKRITVVSGRSCSIMICPELLSIYIESKWSIENARWEKCMSCGKLQNVQVIKANSLEKHLNWVDFENGNHSINPIGAVIFSHENSSRQNLTESRTFRSQFDSFHCVMKAALDRNNDIGYSHRFAKRMKRSFSKTKTAVENFVMRCCGGACA